MSKASLKRVHRKHKAKRKKRLNFLKSSYFYRFFVLFSFILTIFYLFYFSPYFQIQKIEIRESKTFSSEELKKIIQENYGICFEFLGKKFDSKSILLPFNKAALLLEHFPQIEDIVWRRKFPNVLTLEVKERIPFALWCKNEEKDCHLVDKKGKAFEMFEKENIDKLIIIEEKNEIDSLIPRGKMEKEDFLSLTLKIKEELEKAQGFEKIEKFIIFSDKLAVKMPQGLQIFLNPEENLDWQLEKLKILLKEKISKDALKNLEYIDLRFGNQAIIK
ncbi:MAG: hypothetical protein CO144_02235 [Candidatus Nealsonbacteria bacterium CG_4_9_14_3_um_filter_35_11]|uniref:Cell division protein FtsQ/DivIB C-terminal domain-containing protein n=2 Tax=Candidatus Nealsoniibacteriota TaxID=1817911 RepID=A0A2M7DBA5_9BACT|nr:MAG: hypothetical protein COV62_01965 [Candidatus Nealsonbacteria bacterium CG11_big_fil_rev_8_21_14_0_20_35_11]PIV45714.1 MAG: hypothetical protein COS24_00790 [Candidatus Nealsonbacteria bacterium CG02_land_8_20_14_3_00_34_20]PJA84321.1 MAG: hypothetical protein CO144_02235 [Candidatus Nealsonbacteria bacterium CG_4_9_14_3_um_filter_35_11]